MTYKEKYLMLRADVNAVGLIFLQIIFNKLKIPVLD